MKKITQSQVVFYILYNNLLKHNNFLPTWEFIGEKIIYELEKNVFCSYKAPTRLTDIYQQNPGLLERKIIVGSSGAKYYGYRISDLGKIKNKNLDKFYNLIKCH